jgi:gamma-glutamylcyclotransferase (GGCT)/AIG2-like uncharacterized protein YtfP
MRNPFVEDIKVFVYGSLLSGGSQQINVLKRIPFTMSGAKLYKHVDEDYPTMHLTGQEKDLVQGELITITDDVFETLYELESSARYECQAEMIQGQFVHFFHKPLYINRHLKANYLYVNRSWKDYCARND